MKRENLTHLECCFNSRISFQDSVLKIIFSVIVRCIQRLEELCREVRNGARTIGDFNTTSKMEQCSEAIKRDIVFAASLYTQD